MAKGWEQRTGRKTAVRTRRRYLIVCEDSKSSLDYLMAFKIPEEFAEIVPEGGAGNTVSVVEKALDLKQKADYQNRPFVHIWCVIDRDEFPSDRYRRAFELARNHNDITVIWANECFELWYLLHFCYRHTAIGRADLRKELSKPDRLNRQYDKADKSIFDLLEKHRSTAHRNAITLEKNNPTRDLNPSTNVHRLVEKLVELQTAAKET